jgi:type I restriction enzyme S subunit
MDSYDKYRASGIEWIGDIPAHWNIKKLKYLSLVQPSNVDKKSFDDEIKVSLCNYVDVYKNEFIDSSINFMVATATEDEIEKFRIKLGDVLVTKDSETPDDIANPAFVKEELENVVCAYHLTQIRPNRSELFGEYLFRLFQADRYRGQFQVNANGVTRFGLSVASFSDAFVMLPPLEEQIAVSQFLDEKTGQIDKVILNKQRLIELLKEERTAIINQTVIRGTDPNPKLRPSGIDWLGDIPEHWDLVKLKFSVGYTKGHAFKSDIFQSHGTPVIKASDIKNLSIRKGKDFLNPDSVEQFKNVRLSFGDIIISTVGSTPDVTNSAVGQIARVPRDLHGALLNQNTVKFYSTKEDILSEDFLFYLLVSNAYRKYLDLHAHGTANQASLNIGDMLSFVGALPPIHEQKEIVDHLVRSMNAIWKAIAMIAEEVELMRRYRVALISEVISGQIKVVLPQ